MLFSALFMLGCGSGGGGQKVAIQESPEQAVAQVFDSWRTSPESSPSIAVTQDGTFIRQAESGEQSSGIIKIRKLYAPNEEPIIFFIFNKEISGNTAIVYCKDSSGTLFLTFSLVYDEDHWWIDDIVVTDKGTDTGSDTSSETGSDTGSSTGSDTGSDTSSDTGSETSSATESDTSSETGSETETTTDTYIITGVVTDDSDNPVVNAIIKFYIVDESTGKSSEFKDDSGKQVELTTDSNGKYDTSTLDGVEIQAGEYLLVVYKDGYEAQTKKVKVPQSSESNIRANIKL